MKAIPWDHLGEALALEAKIFRVLKDRARSPNTGREHAFDILDSPDWVNVIALTPNGRVVLIRQYRAGTRAVTIEVPGGVVERGEAPLRAAQRELMEETGYSAPEWELLGQVQPNPAFQTNTTHTYLARGATRTASPSPDENEEIEVEECQLAEVAAQIRDGRIRHALVLCAFFHLMLRRGLGLEGTRETR